MGMQGKHFRKVDIDKKMYIGSQIEDNNKLSIQINFLDTTKVQLAIGEHYKSQDIYFGS